MQRRSFIQKAAVGAAAGTIAGAPAIVSAQPQIRWRLASSFPKSLDAIFGAGEVVSRRVSAMTGGKFQISVHAAGEIVPGLQVLDAVQNGTVEMGHTAVYYFFGKEPTWALGTAVPFGLNARQYNAWWHQGGGDKLFNEFTTGKFGVHALLTGNTGAQMGGWFRKEINGLDDLKGLKFRIAGVAGMMLAKLGVVPQQLAAGDIYSSLEKGAIDAAEWTVPHDDEKLGFQKVAKYYYYPGFWEGGPMVQAFVNLEKWNSLPKNYQAILANAAANTNAWMPARYDMQNPGALKRLVASGTQLRPFTNEVLDACLKAANEIYADISSKNADFKKVIDAMIAYRSDQYLWWQVAEYTNDSFMIRSRTRG